MLWLDRLPECGLNEVMNIKNIGHLSTHKALHKITLRNILTHELLEIATT